MSKVTVYVGLDYHKDSIQVCIMDTAGKILANRSCSNQAKAVVALVAAHGQDVHAAVEAWRLGQPADEAATEHGWVIDDFPVRYVAHADPRHDRPPPHPTFPPTSSLPQLPTPTLPIPHFKHPTNYTLLPHPLDAPWR